MELESRWLKILLRQKSEVLLQVVIYLTKNNNDLDNTYT